MRALLRSRTLADRAIWRGGLPRCVGAAAAAGVNPSGPGSVAVRPTTLFLFVHRPVALRRGARHSHRHRGRLLHWFGGLCIRRCVPIHSEGRITSCGGRYLAIEEAGVRLSKLGNLWIATDLYQRGFYQWTPLSL